MRHALALDLRDDPLLIEQYEQLDASRRKVGGDDAAVQPARLP